MGRRFRDETPPFLYARHVRVRPVRKPRPRALLAQPSIVEIGTYNRICMVRASSTQYGSTAQTAPWRTVIMSQSVASIGDSNGSGAGIGRARFLTETVVLAYGTLLIYVTAGAYQLGYQDKFGLTYLSLGVEDLIDIMREFIEFLVIIISMTIAASFVIMLVRKTSRESQLSSVVFLIAPISCSTMFYWSFGRHGRLVSIDPTTYWLVLAYYVLDVSIWSWLFRVSGSTEFQVPVKLYFRSLQVGVASLALTLITYSVGVIDALNKPEFEKCPIFQDKQSVLIQRTNDLAICAETDFSIKTIYANFFYFKVPASGSPQYFETVTFHPDQVGQRKP